MTARRWAALTCVLIATTVACSDDKNADSPAGGDTTAPAGTGGVITTEGAGSTDDGIEGAWVVVRRVTENNGYFNEEEGREPIVQYRMYDVTCADASCEQVSAEVTRASGNMSSTPLVMQFDGSTLTVDEALPAACLNADGTGLDGPQEEIDTTTIDLSAQTSDGAIVSFVGEYTFSAKSEASAGCSAVDVSYTADMVMFRPDRVTLDELSDGVFWGDGLLGPAMRAVHTCVDNTCLLREPYSIIHEDGEEAVYLEGTIKKNSDNSYSGAITFKDSCLDQATSLWIADDAYDLAIGATVAYAQVPGWDEPVLLIIETITAQPVAGLQADVAEACPAFNRTLAFAGIPSQMDDRIDLAAPALGTDI